jgi:hypothetical protein
MPTIANSSATAAKIVSTSVLKSFVAVDRDRISSIVRIGATARPPPQLALLIYRLLRFGKTYAASVRTPTSKNTNNANSKP